MISRAAVAAALAVAGLFSAQVVAQPCLTMDQTKYYQILNQWSGQPLTVDGASTAVGANINQGSMVPGPNKNFRFQAGSSPGYYHLIAEHSGQCVVGTLFVSRAPYRRNVLSLYHVADSHHALVLFGP